MRTGPTVPELVDSIVLKETLGFVDVYVKSSGFQVFQIIIISPGKLNRILGTQCSPFSLQDGGMLGPPQIPESGLQRETSSRREIPKNTQEDTWGCGTVEFLGHSGGHYSKANSMFIESLTCARTRAKLLKDITTSCPDYHPMKQVQFYYHQHTDGKPRSNMTASK